MWACLCWGWAWAALLWLLPATLLVRQPERKIKFSIIFLKIFPINKLKESKVAALMSQNINNNFVFAGKDDFKQT